MVYWISMVLYWIFCTIFFPTRVIGRKNMHKKKCIWAPNHTTNFDFLILGTKHFCRFYGLGKAELFRSETVLVSLRNTLEPDQIRMYTLVFWLEGDDPECNLIPDEASLRIGATINGYPQSKKVD